MADYFYCLSAQIYPKWFFEGVVELAGPLTKLKADCLHTRLANEENQ